MSEVWGLFISSGPHHARFAVSVSISRDRIPANKSKPGENAQYAFEELTKLMSEKAAGEEFCLAVGYNLGIRAQVHVALIDFANSLSVTNLEVTSSV